jgi:GNAT superfamily N-acetyltransferase
MVSLSPEAAEHVLAWEDGSRRAVALHHALIRRRGEFWGDHPKRPESLVLIRPGDGRYEAFGAGAPEPAVSWLAKRPGPIALLAPDSWTEAIHAAVGPLEQGRVQARFRPGPPPSLPTTPSIRMRRLQAEDHARFMAVAPSWALQGWDSTAELMKQGAAFGVPFGEGFVAISWILEQDHSIDLIGVHVASRYRRLGLGHAVASALVNHVILERRKCPLWVAADENTASRALARRLGFSLMFQETLLRWPPVNSVAPEHSIKGSADAD